MSSASRRHSVSGSPWGNDVDMAPPRSDQMILGGMRETRSSSIRFNEPRGIPEVAPQTSRRATHSQSGFTEKSEYGFTIKSKDGEERLKNIEGRIVSNHDFDNDFLQKIGFHNDIYKLLSNIGWMQFSLIGPVSV